MYNIHTYIEDIIRLIQNQNIKFDNLPKTLP